MDKMTASPVEFDTALAALYQDRYTAAVAITRAWTHVHYAAGDRKDYRTGWRMTHEEARVKVVALKNNEKESSWSRKSAAELLNGLGLARQKMVDISEEIAEFNRVFRERGGWSRIFLVTNGNGHAHSSMDCHTCFPTTQFHWVTELSGHSEAEIVNAAADRACTVCFPTAPVNKPSTLRTPDEIEKAEAKAKREADKAAREAIRIAKAPTKNGEPLVIDDGSRFGETFKTERAATIWATDAIAWGYMNSDRGVQQVIDAIAEKHSVSPESIRAEFEKKADKKRRA